MYAGSDWIGTANIFFFDYLINSSTNILFLLFQAINSQVVIVASMLVSPLMGPLLAITFGTVLQDRALISQGLKAKLYGVIISFAVGFVVVFPLGFLVEYSTPERFPTSEMISRGTSIGLAFGVLIAIASGVAIALAVTDGGVNGLVGVAISASLLPPIVNTGMCLGWGILWAFLIGPDRYHSYARSMWMLRISGISFALFVLNVICIFLVGLGVFKFKQVAPIPMHRSKFWNNLPTILRTPQADRPWAVHPHVASQSTTPEQDTASSQSEPQLSTPRV